MYFFFSLFARQREEKVPKRRESTLVSYALRAKDQMAVFGFAESILASKLVTLSLKQSLPKSYVNYTSVALRASNVAKKGELSLFSAYKLFAEWLASI